MESFAKLAIFGARILNQSKSKGRQKHVTFPGFQVVIQILNQSKSKFA